MKKLLDPNSHAVLDYALGIACLTIPVVAGFNRISSIASYTIGVVQLGLSLFTNYPVSAVKAIPFRVHGIIELGTAIQLMTVPLMIKALDVRAKTFFMSSGAGLLAIYLMTDYSQDAVIVAEREFEELKQEGIEKVEHMVDNSAVPTQIKQAIRKAS